MAASLRGRKITGSLKGTLRGAAARGQGTLRGRKITGSLKDRELGGDRAQQFLSPWSKDRGLIEERIGLGERPGP